MNKSPENTITKIYGTTIYIGEIEIETIYGKFMTYTFQDLIHKGYIIALVHGDIHSEVLYTRMHSSCVTSETLRSLDCDCVSQLYGALKKISEGNGILFYLIQEGRGCGYVGKSRACMMVQYKEDTNEEINTFQAYESLGMKHDYRDYTNVKDICKMMSINGEFILLTNNPDKIEKFNKTGLKLKNIESIEIQPNPFNQQYLHSKQQYGHILYQTKTKISKYVLPYEKVKPFEPYNLTDCNRFVYVSSYYLPIKPVNNNVVLTESELNRLKSKYSDSPFRYQLIDVPENKHEEKESHYYVHINDVKIIEDNKELLCKPYWFKVNVFYDIVTHQDYLVLEYGDCKDKSKVPIIRIHSESLFNRFPLIDREYKNRYRKTLELIIRNGCGMILILYNDGRGSGLGYYVLNKNITDQDKIGVDSYLCQSSPLESVEYDKRDYYGAIKLIKKFITSEQKIDIVHGDSSENILKDVLTKHKLNVRSWINVSKKADQFGHTSIHTRMSNLYKNVVSLMDEIKTNANYKNLKSFVKNNDRICVTGIGSSEAHARYLERMLMKEYNIRYVNSVDVNKKDYNKLIIFTQGLSPNATIPIERFEYSDIIIITTYTSTPITEKNNVSLKDSVLEKIKTNNNIIINYPKETEDDTLIRITGPYVGYIIGLEIARNMASDFTYEGKEIMEITRETDITIIPYILNNIVENRKITIIMDGNEKNYITNIKNKFMEGLFVDVVVCDGLEFTHGTYQLMEHNRKNGILNSVFIINKNESISNKELNKKIYQLLKDKYPIQLVNIRNDILSILELEMKFNQIVYQLIQMMRINQKNWSGKKDQNQIYNITKI